MSCRIGKYSSKFGKCVRPETGVVAITNSKQNAIKMCKKIRNKDYNCTYYKVKVGFFGNRTYKIYRFKRKK